MSKLPRVSGKDVVAALRKAGFDLSHVRGSHHFLRKPGANVLVVVPVHANRDLPTGTLRAIARQAGLTALLGCQALLNSLESVESRDPGGRDPIQKAERRPRWPPPRPVTARIRQ